MTLVIFWPHPVDNLGANPVILDLLPDNLKDDIVYSVNSVTEKPMLRAVLMWSFVARRLFLHAGKCSDKVSGIARAFVTQILCRPLSVTAYSLLSH